MLAFSLAFLIGVITLLFFKTLSILNWIVIFLIIILVIVLLRLINSFFKKILIGFLLGFSWCLLFSISQLSWQLPNELEGKKIEIVGTVASIPAMDLDQTKFLFSGCRLAQKTRGWHDGRVKLSWRGEHPELHVGDQWKFIAKLKRIHGTFNPGGFDYEAWAFSENIRAQGYIIENKNNLMLASEWFSHPIDRVREFLKNKISNVLPKSKTSAWINALTIGERNNISSEQWEVLRNTGTNHLMAIAGLHIGFLAGFAYTIVSFFWKRSFLAFKIPAQHAGAIASLIIALLYSALSGFAVPAQRACLMLIIFLMTLLLRRNLIAWHAWSTALLFVLILNPLNVLNASFWLSFGSVAIIIYGVSARLFSGTLWWKLGRTQWVIAIGLIPLSIALFQQVSIVSFIANSIAIPWMGFLILPFCFLGTVSCLFSVKLGGLFLLFADQSLNYLWAILEWFSQLHFSSWMQVIPDIRIIFIACVGILFLLLPAGFPGRYFGALFLLPMIFFHYPTPKINTAWITLLDVGQGLSAVIQTQNHVLVFDAGAKYKNSIDVGESIVIPFLRANGIKKIDTLVVSHGDNDHLGGINAVLNQFPVSQIKTSVPEKINHVAVKYCMRQDAWDWDGVHFEFLYPSQDQFHLNNDSSCVLSVSAQGQSILLPGDIEKNAENYLVQNNLLKYFNILIAPHHGSKTSAEDLFIQKTHPKYVLFSIGYLNRYHFPNQSVVEKYQKINSIMLETASSGAIQFKLGENLEPSLYRLQKKRFYFSPSNS